MTERPGPDRADPPDLDEVLSRAEDLLARGRGGRDAAPPPPADLPTLTEFAELDDVQESYATPLHAAAREPLEPQRPPAGEAQRGEGVDSGTMRLEILAQLAPVLERLVESRMAERLGELAASIALSVKEQLESEIRTIVRDAIDRALLSEVERVQSTQEKS